MTIVVKSQLPVGDPLRDTIDQLNRIPILDGRLVDCLFYVADGTSKSFPHGLGRPWRGAMIVGGSAASGVQCTTNTPKSSLASPDKVQILLSSAADATITLWVF